MRMLMINKPANYSKDYAKLAVLLKINCFSFVCVFVTFEKYKRS